MSLVAFLAWVGLGADGLSSSAYGPEEAFKALGEHRYLAVFLALMIAATVGIPPLVVIAVIAGPMMHIKFVPFTIICFVGRLGRFGVMTFVAYAAM